MKKLIFLIVATLVSVVANAGISRAVSPLQKTSSNPDCDYTESKPLVVEGRTWWYESISMKDDPADYGVMIGKEVDINGIKWNEIRVVKSMLHSYEGSWYNCKKENELVGYIRQDGNQVFSIPLSNHTFKPINELKFWNKSGENEQFLIYDYSLTNNHFYFEFPQGDKYRVGFNVNSVEEIQNSGNVYNEWQAEYDGQINESLLETPINTMFTYAEGIGITKAFNLSMLFYMPWETAVDGSYSYQKPTLRYVTDGPDNTVIYEGIGGKKLWEEALSVENISVDSNLFDIEWYTIQGIRIDKPGTPGVYIRRQGRVSEKIQVK